jgi:hypothetical protein
MITRRVNPGKITKRDGRNCPSFQLVKGQKQKLFLCLCGGLDGGRSPASNEIIAAKAMRRMALGSAATFFANILFRKKSAF